MKPIIQFNQVPCDHCIKCVKECPVDAISILDGIVKIDESKCIHCDICVRACVDKKLSAHGDHLSTTMGQYDYTVALLPTCFLSETREYIDIKKIALAVKKLGFDEVIQYSDIEGFMYERSLRCSKERSDISITSFCPTIDKLVENEYPTLYDRLLQYDYPEEILAKQLRKKYVDRKLGIYSLCPCIGKLTLAKHPYGNEDSEIDHAISISHLFPKINALKSDETLDLDLCKSGVKHVTCDLFGKEDINCVSVDGLDQVRNVLELIEFDQLEDIDLVALYACYQGCIGGYYLWANPYEGVRNVKHVVDQCILPIKKLKKEEYLKDRESNSETIDFKEKMAWFNKVNEILETLPQYDCGSCGFANCRNLANHIAKGEVTDELCRVKKR